MDFAWSTHWHGQFIIVMIAVEVKLWQNGVLREVLGGQSGAVMPVIRCRTGLPRIWLSQRVNTAIDYSPDAQLEIGVMVHALKSIFGIGLYIRSIVHRTLARQTEIFR